ncbi:MAG: hypothetical protein QOD24_4581 [Solirubrobacteraceae bacterium]|jgi:hypothetical protein|nr:hypothetical protein [Solirubrobacteraceae bacterium]
MTSNITPRARLRGDRAGDPLDGLVNLFDLGIVLAVAFLLAALQSVNLTELLTRKNVTVVRNDSSGQTLIVKQGDQLKTVHLSRQTVTGAGERVGDVFRLADGRLVYVQRAPASSATPPATTAPTTTTP